MLTAILRRLIPALAVWVLAPAGAPAQSLQDLQVDVILDPALPAQPPGRLLIVLAEGSAGVEPRRLIARTGSDAVPTLGVDAPALAPGGRVTVEGAVASHFPLAEVATLPAGEYRVQAVLRTNRDLRAFDAPGTLFSDVVQVSLGPERAGSATLTLAHRLPEESLPPSTRFLRFVKLRSDLLSAFHGRPIYLRAGVILPVGFDREPQRRYPLRVRIGGFGVRYTAVQSLMRTGSPFRAAWTDQDADAPRMLLLHLDGAGPFGDPYQVNSANNVEREFRGVGTRDARVLDGSSTGGWVSLALQMFYPDVFNGAWASCPDSVDFRAFQRVDIYGDASAYLDERGGEQASARNLDGSVRFTMRHELRMENVLGAGGNWATSGRQWGAWNAAYGPRGADGQPVPLWDPQTGRIDPTVARHWERYDLRLQLEQEWDTLAPKLDGTLNIWVGDMDNYFLNEAVHLFEQFLGTRPSLDARVAYGQGRGHCWTGISPGEMMREMASTVTQ